MKRLWLFAAIFGLCLALPPDARAADVTLPARGCFYYGWFPETNTGIYHPTLAGSNTNHRYNSSDPYVVDQHGQALKYAKCEVPILTWWGPTRHSEQVRVPLALDRWWSGTWGYLKPTIYYECEGTPATGTAGCPGAPNPPVPQIQAHLAYLQTYANHSRWARVNGKPVIFVYSSGDSACEVASRWKQAAPNWYVSLKLSSGFRDCADQPDAWHQYGPSSAYHQHEPFYTNISPGFCKTGQNPCPLPRDLTRFKQNIRDMVAAGMPWQLVTSFSEWGEGTAIESGRAIDGSIEWESTLPTQYGDYVNALMTDGQ